MHKSGVDTGKAGGGRGRRRCFASPRILPHQQIQLGFRMPMWETVNGSLMKACLTEFFCVTIFIYVATGTVVFGCHSSDASTSGTSAATGQTVQPEDCFLNNSRVVTIAMAFGFSILVLVYSAASFSGGHLNPAVTMGFVVSKKITLLRALCYWVMQLLGAILGSSFVYATDRTGWHAAKGGTNRLLPGISKASGWLLETLLTMLLVFTVLAATDSSRARISTHLPVLAPAAIGFAVFVSHLAAVPLDGCSINPARSFGPAVVTGVWTDQWIFWVGPFSGAIIAAVLYELFFRPSGNMELPHHHDDDHGGFSDDDLGAAEQGRRRQQGQHHALLPPYSGVSGVKVRDDHATGRLRLATPAGGRSARTSETTFDVQPGSAAGGGFHTPGGRSGSGVMSSNNPNVPPSDTCDVNSGMPREKRLRGAVDANPNVSADGVPGTTGSYV